MSTNMMEKPMDDEFVKAREESAKRIAEANAETARILDKHASVPKKLEDVFRDVAGAKASAWELSKKDNLKD